MDPIDRQEILAETDKWLNDLHEDDSAKDIRVGIRMVRVYMKKMSAVQPERKTGQWIEYIPEHGKCPFCGNLVDLMNGKENNYCGECGADMRGE